MPNQLTVIVNDEANVVQYMEFISKLCMLRMHTSQANITDNLMTHQTQIILIES